MIALKEKQEFCDAKHVEEVTKLRKENEHMNIINDELQKELNAFDLEFFEEIEDLKFKYNELGCKMKYRKES